MNTFDHPFGGRKTAMSSAAAEELKATANDLFKSGQYANAIQPYTQAIELDPRNAVLYSNRSAAYLMASKASEALADALQAVSLRPTWEKGHFRQGAALEKLGKPGEALKAYQAALDLSPKNQELIDKVRKLKLAGKADHQKQKQQPDGSRKTSHNRQRQQQKGVGGAMSAQGMPAPSGWAAGLTAAQQAEWFVDCYRMRVDDDYALGGCNLHGLYDPDATPDIIIKDFLVFCKLAARHSVLPLGFSWAACLQQAAKLLPYAFEKEDAKDKWGRENIFSAMLGGRSLRFTGEVVYGYSCVYGSASSEDAAAHNEVYKQVEQVSWQRLVAADHSSLFADVGGVEAWVKLRKTLQQPLRL